MNLLHLRYFVELAGTQHYTRAAEKLCITQPSLSHAMAQLAFDNLAAHFAARTRADGEGLPGPGGPGFPAR